MKQVQYCGQHQPQEIIEVPDEFAERLIKGGRYKLYGSSDTISDSGVEPDNRPTKKNRNREDK